MPEDISVAGYDDYLYAEFGDSKIMTYSVDMAGVSEIALSCIIKRIEDTAIATTIHIVNGRLIERETVKKLS